MHQVAQTLVHAFDKRGIGRLLFRQSLAEITVQITRVGVDGDMDGVVCHVQEEGSVQDLGTVEGSDGLARQGLCDKGSRLPILLQSRHRHGRCSLSLGIVAVIPLAVVGGKTSCGMAGNVDIETEMSGVGSRRSDGSPMRLAAMNGMVSGIVQQLHKGGGNIGTWRAGVLRNAVDVPLRRGDLGMRIVSRTVAVQRPVRHPVAGGIASRKEAATAGRTDSRCIGLGEHHTLSSQTLHVRSVVATVEVGGSVPKGDGSVLPSHIVDKKEQNVRRPLCLGRCRLCIHHLWKETKRKGDCRPVEVYHRERKHEGV